MKTHYVVPPSASPAIPGARPTVNDRLRGLLTREESFHFTPDLGDDVSLVDAGAIDSFGMIALVIRIEEEFGVTVTPEEATADRFRSVSSIAAYIESKLDGHHRG